MDDVGVWCVQLQLCPTLRDPMDCNLWGFSVHGILQARILEWVAMPSSKGSSWPRNWTHVSCVSCIAGIDSLPLSHWGNPNRWYLPHIGTLLRLSSSSSFQGLFTEWVILRILVYWMLKGLLALKKYKLLNKMRQTALHFYEVSRD